MGVSTCISLYMYYRTAVEVGAQVNQIEVDLYNKPPLYTAEVNPYGTVPCLYDDGFPVFESAIVAQYLATKYDEKKLDLFCLGDPQLASIVALANGISS